MSINLTFISIQPICNQAERDFFSLERNCILFKNYYNMKFENSVYSDYSHVATKINIQPPAHL